ncbi:DUF4202 domain-containing protein [Leeuwenhoekiella sp. A16]|uniref:DUF4202 domain-containing protein n=1 Tax=unclassified Leeuwenhoekiella TaxID=2615029 RepID=UPI003A7FF861
MTKIEQAAALIDEKNSQDPHIEIAAGKEYPKELLYSLRMVQKLLQFKPDASEELQIAARAQHICRWMSPREQYPMDRIGYLKWREDLKKMHADITAKILEKTGYSADFIDRVSFLIKKKLIKKDEGTQTLEDVICLVFLENYLEEFAAKHPDEKIVDILQKTWGKMSEEGHEAALQLPLTPHSMELIKKALA